MNVSNHSFLISKPHSVWELNRVWNIIISLGPHADLPFISDLGNLLSPQENLIKIPVISALQPIFLSSFPSCPSLPLSPQTSHSILPFQAPLKENKLPKWLVLLILSCYGGQKRKNSFRICRNASVDKGPGDWGVGMCVNHSCFHHFPFSLQEKGQHLGMRLWSVIGAGLNLGFCGLKSKNQKVVSGDTGELPPNTSSSANSWQIAPFIEHLVTASCFFRAWLSVSHHPQAQLPWHLLFCSWNFPA